MFEQKYVFFLCLRQNRGADRHVSVCSLKSLSLLTGLEHPLKAFHIFCISIPEYVRALGLPKRVYFSGFYHVRSSGSCTLLETPAGSICVPTKSFRDYLRGSLGNRCRSSRPQICPSSHLIKKRERRIQNKQKTHTAKHLQTRREKPAKRNIDARITNKKHRGIDA